MKYIYAVVKRDKYIHAQLLVSGVKKVNEPEIPGTPSSFIQSLRLCTASQ